MIIVAAGKSRRMGGPAKIWMSFAGKPVLQWTLSRFVNAGVHTGVVVAQENDHGRIRQLLDEMELDRVQVVAGGAERYQSVAAGLKVLPPAAAADDILLVHDAARFMVSQTLIHRVLESVRIHRTGIPVLSISDTVKELDENGAIVRTVPRHSLALAQTPQGFQRTILETGYQNWPRGQVPTDDAEVVENLGILVQTLTGDPTNQKLTRPADVPWFIELLKRQGEME